MTTFEDVGALSAALRQSPLDALCWSALADACEERGLEAAACMARRVGGCVARRAVRPDEMGSAGRDYLRQIKRALGYRRRKLRVEVTTEFCAQDVQWSGGSRNTYLWFECPSRQWISLTALSEGETRAVERGVVVVERGIFQGKVCGVCLYVHPLDVEWLLR